MPSTTLLETLTINHVESQAVYDAMNAKDLINENELYLIPGDLDVDNTPGGTKDSDALITSGAAWAGFAPKNNAIYFVKGTQTATTNVWTGVLSAVDRLYDGLTIAYFLPQAGNSSSATLTLELSDNTETAAEPVYYTSTSRATTHFGVGSVILLTWVSNTTTGYSAVGSASGRWLHADYDANSNTVPAAYCSTAAATAAKTATHTNYALRPNSYELVTITQANTAKAKLTLNINSTGDKTIYINGVVSSSSNYTLPAGTYLVFYDGTNYYFRPDGKITGSITGDAATVGGHTVAVNVPSDALFSDTTYNLSSTTNGSLTVHNNNTSDEYSIGVYTLPTATADNLGGVKIGYSQSGKNYPVQLSDGKMYVNVPWTNVNDNYLTGNDISIPSSVPKATWGSGVTVGSIDDNEFKFEMPDNPNTDTLVKQENSTANSTLRVLLSHDANDTTTTNSSYKSGNLTFNPSSGTLTATNLRGALTSSQVTTALGFTPYTKTEVNNLIASVFHYKGTKATVSALPTSSNATGDVWHVTADGSEYVWNGSAWEELGTVVDLSGYAQLSGANFTGPVNFGDSVTADDVTTGSLVVTGNASFTNNISANTINGVEVGSNPKFTDTTYTTTQSAKTNITISNHTTTSVGSASNWSAGSASNWVFEDVSCDDITAWSAGSFTRGTFAGGSGSFTQGSFNGGSGSFSASVSNHIMSFSHTHTAATHGADSHTHIAATHAADSFTAPSLTYSAKTASHVKSGGNGTAPSLTISSVTVTNGTSHTVTDNGHTHSI